VESRPLHEETLVVRAKRGDVNAYEELVRMHQGIAFRVALATAGDRADAEEAVQDAFVKAYRALRRFRAGAPFRPWLLRIVANESRNRRRSAGRRAGLALRAATAASGDAAPSPEATVLARERREVLLDGLGRLDERDRDVLVHRFLLDLGEEETAAALGVRRGTVKSRTSRALERLRVLVGEEGPS
jgi:RNA polymerase sigma factor (sigma-70 family)